MHFLKSLNIAWLFFVVLLTGCTSITEQPEILSSQGVIESRDGVPIVYESFGEGETTVVFVHCWACNRDFWRYQVEPVTEAGYRVVTIDLPGHGESGAGRETWSMEEIVSDVETVVRTLDLERVVLVGHAMGGQLALAAASRVPERVIGIGCAAALRNAEFEWPKGSTAVLAAVIGIDFRQGLESYIQPFLAPGTDPELFQWIVDQAEASDQTAVLDLMADFPTMDLPSLFSSTSVPIRCINAVPGGRSSPPTEFEINRQYADFDAVLMKDVRQYPQLEQPEAFNAHLLDLLAELTDRAQ